MNNGGELRRAQKTAGHGSATQLYDRRDQQVALDEVERIIL